MKSVRNIILSVLVGVQLCLPAVTGDHILFFNQVNSYSHKVAKWPLAETLVSRGHNVTFIAPQPSKTPHPQIREVIPPSLESHFREIQEAVYDVQIRVNNAITLMLYTVFDYGYGGCVVLYESPEFQAWLKSKPDVDLVIVDSAVCVECGVGVAYKLGAKVIVFSGMAPFPYEYDTYGYQPESSAVPEMEVGAPQRPMEFWGRVNNALMSLRWYWQYSTDYIPKMDALIRDKLQIGPEMPSIGDVVRSKVSLVFTTGDVLTDYPRALPPNHVNIAGLHCHDSKQTLPKDIERFLQSPDSGDASDGFVYISLGSIVNPSKLPEHILQVFFQTIEAFPRLKFLWRWNSEVPKNAPKNLQFSKWFPQNDLLGHSKIRAFVTQGGRPSTLEGVWHGVPMISFPVLGDQDYNANRVMETGSSIKLEIVTVSTEEFRGALSKAVYGSTMRERMTHLKKLFRDRPNSPLDTAVWWTEYVLRTPNTEHLRPAGYDQSWFVRRQIDVWAFLTVLIFTGTIGTAVICCKMGKLVFLSSKKEKRKIS